MDLNHLRIKEIESVSRYIPSKTHWKAMNRKTHIIGISMGGCAHHDFGYQHITLKDTCVLYFNQKDDYAVETHEKNESYCVHFTTYEPISTDSFCKKVNNFNEIMHLLSHLDHLYKTNHHKDALAMSQLYKLCSLINGYHTEKYTPQDSRILKSKEYIDLHFKEPDCLATAAALSGVTSRRFQDLFKAQYHTTPGNYMSQQKIQTAKHLLEIGGLSVTQVSELCGFSDVYYFSKVFKAITGLTPSEYQRSGNC